MKRQNIPLGSSEITRALINSASTGIYMVQGGRFTYVSPQFVKQSGYDEKDVLGKKSLGFVYAGDREEVHKNAIACLKGLRSTPYEYRFRTKNGDLLWIVEKVASVELKGKRAAVGSFMDITDVKRMEDELRQQKELASSLLDVAPNPIMVAGLDSSIKYVNRALENVTGFASSELAGKKMPYPYWPPESEAGLIKFIEAFLAGSGPSRQEIEFRKKNGERFWAEVTLAMWGTPACLLSSWIDITASRKIKEELRLKAKLLDEATDSIIVHDLEGRIIFANEAASRMRGYQHEELMQLNVQQLIAQNQKWVYVVQIPVLLKNEVLIFEADNLRKDGTRIPMEVHSRLIELDSKKMVISIGRDVMERRKAENELLYMANHDLLTGLPNRNLLSDRLDVALAQSTRNKKSLVIMMMDLDRFKYVNDEFGHIVGDKLLKTAGERLTRMLRKSDTVARIGGDEFVIVLPEVETVADADKLANKMLKEFKKPFVIDEHKLNITTSIGIAVYPADGENADILMRNADKSMYRAKQKGRDTYEFSAQYGLQL
jgi:diguanylate cyclase (GGDEF)-like protein/PAS domain S-box-containing protein